MAKPEWVQLSLRADRTNDQRYKLKLFYPFIDSLLNLYPSLKSLILSVVIFLVYLGVKKLVHRKIDKGELSTPEKVMLKQKFSQYLTYFLFVCVFFIWFVRLQVFFVSILAVAAAIVIAIKELIMCLTGGLLVKMSNVFSLGHRIDIEGTRGFVVEKSLLATKILEIGPEKNSQQTTGDVITIPNSIMLAKNIKNESYFQGYTMKSFSFRVENEADIYDLESKMLGLATEISQGYLVEAKNAINLFCEKEGLLVPSLNPRTKIILDEGKDFSVLVKLPVKISEIANVEQILNRFFLDWRLSSIQLNSRNSIEGWVCA